GWSVVIFYFFFFQAEDGIRDFHVTGVQTCALPICVQAASRVMASKASPRPASRTSSRDTVGSSASSRRTTASASLATRCRRSCRSEERRVGKECRSRWAGDQEEKK